MLPTIAVASEVGRNHLKDHKRGILQYCRIFLKYTYQVKEVYFLSITRSFMFIH